MAILAHDIEAQIDNALKAARPFLPEEQASSVIYVQLNDEFRIVLRSGEVLAVSRGELQDVAEASWEQAANVQLDMLDSAVWWPDLDVAFQVKELVQGVRGDIAWMGTLQERKKLAFAA